MNLPEVILIIDDEVQIRRLLEITISSGGYKVCEAATGKDGLIAAATNNPNLIILDLGLPDTDGLEILKKLREWYTRPVIILSVRNSEDDIIKALDYGANDYLTKPFRTGELLARVRVALRHRTSPEDKPILYIRCINNRSGRPCCKKERGDSETDNNRIFFAGITGEELRKSPHASFNS